MSEYATREDFRVMETYSFRDKLMEIHRHVVAETDKSRMNAICEHYEIDLSELLEWIEWKRKKPKTNADRIRAMTDEELASKFEHIQLEAVKAYGNDELLLAGELYEYWLKWLKKEVG